MGALVEVVTMKRQALLTDLLGLLLDPRVEGLFALFRLLSFVADIPELSQTPQKPVADRHLCASERSLLSLSSLRGATTDCTRLSRDKTLSLPLLFLLLSSSARREVSERERDRDSEQQGRCQNCQETGTHFQKGLPDLVGSHCSFHMRPCRILYRPFSLVSYFVKMLLKV